MAKTEKYCPNCRKTTHDTDAKHCKNCGTKLKERPIRVKLPKGLRDKVYRRDGYRCQMCGASKNDEGIFLDIDHIIPRDKGGTDDIENLQVLCRECNENKANLILPSGLETDIETTANELNSLNESLRNYLIKLKNATSEDEELDCKFHIKKITEEDIPPVKSKLEKLNEEYKLELEKLKLKKQEQQKQDKLFKKLYLYIDDSTLNLLKNHFSINKNSKHDILKVLTKEHAEKEINNVIFNNFNNRLNDEQRFLSCYRFDNSKENFVDYLLKNKLSMNNLVMELDASKYKLANELRENLTNLQKYLLKQYFSLGECSDSDLINHAIKLGYNEKKLVKTIESYKSQLFDEFESTLTKKHLKLIKKHYNIEGYSKTDTILYLFGKNLYQISEVMEIIEDELIKELNKNLDVRKTSLLKFKFSHCKTDKELYTFLVRKGYTIDYINELVESVDKELYDKLKKELDYQKVYEISRKLNLPNSKEKVIRYLIDNYTVEGIKRFNELLE